MAFAVLGSEHIRKTSGTPYGKIQPVTLHRVDCPTNHPRRCDLTDQGLNQKQLPKLQPSKFFHLVYFDKNNLQYVPKGTFDHHPEIIYLTLERNQLMMIDKYMLQKLSKLKYFNAAYNHLFGIHPHAFKETLNLITLVLNNNHLRELPAEILCDLKHLKELYLHDNNMTTFEILPNCEPENLTEMTLLGNPLCCNERMAWIKERERQGRVHWGVGPDKLLLTPTCINFPDTHWFNISDVELGNGAYVIVLKPVHTVRLRLRFLL